MRKLVPLILCIVLMATVVGCQPATQPPASPEPEKTTVPEATTAPEEKASPTAETVVQPTNTEPAPEPEPTEAPLDIWAKYDPPIEISTYKISDANLKYPAGMDMNNNLWTQLYEKELGIKVKFLWSVPQEQKDTKININIASNDMPDISLVNQQQLKMMVENDMVYDLTDLYNTYASDIVKKIAENDKYLSLNGGTIDGRIYGLPETWGNENGWVLYIRTDWLENVGMDIPKTIDELVAVADAFVNKDPDQNGQKDTIGLPITSNFFAPVGGATGFFYGFHAYPTIMLPDENGVKFGGVQPEVKAALEKLAEMYKNGLLDPEFATRDMNKIMELAVSDKIGMFYGEDWAQFYWPFPSHKTTNPKAEWRAIELPSVDGKPTKIAKTGGAGTYFVVNKNCKHPEAAIKLYNISSKYLSLISPDYNEDLHVKVFDDGEKYITWQWQALNNPGPNQFTGLKFMREWWEAGKPQDYWEKYNPWVADMMEQISKYLGLKEGSDNMWNWVTYVWINPETGAVPVIEKYFTEDRIVMSAYMGVATPTSVERGATLEKLRDEVFTRIVMGQDSIDAFDKYVKDWFALGGEDIIKEINEELK